MDKIREKLIGYIYKVKNILNDKIYIGQTRNDRWNEGSIPIKERWNEEVNEAKRRFRRGENLRYVEYAIIKYGSESFLLHEKETVYGSQEDLDERETKWIKYYDSLNPEKGYNLKEGGRGGRLSEKVKKELSKVHKKKWKEDIEYKKKQQAERRERAKDKEWVEHMTEINRKSSFREI